MKPNYIIRLLVLLLFMVTGQKAFSQWAGPDQEILRNDNNTQTVTLSVVDYDPQACYNWSGPNIQGNPPQPTGPTVTINPQNETQTYICTRTSYMGVDEDAVVVKVYDSVRIDSVTPIKNCYQPGDPVSTDQFRIVTQPRGKENLVIVSPTAIPEFNVAWAYWFTQPEWIGRKDVELTFSISGYNTSKQCKVPCIDKDLSSSNEIPFEISQSIHNFLQIKNCMTFLKKAANLATAVNQFVYFNPVPQDTFMWTEPSFSYHWDCCNNQIQRVTHVEWNGFQYSYYNEFFTPSIPLPLGIPGLRLYASCGLGWALSVGYTSIDFSLDPNCSEAKIGVRLSGNVTGNVGVAWINPKIIDFRGGVEGSGATTGYWDIINQKLEAELEITASLVAQISLLSRVIWKGKKTFAKWKI